MRRAYIVEVLAVAAGPIHDELMQAGAAPKYQLIAQERMLRNFDDQPRQHEVLLDRVERRPCPLDGPRLNDRTWDHRSGSTSAFSMMPHLASALPLLGPPA